MLVTYGSNRIESDSVVRSNMNWNSIKVWDFLLFVINNSFEQLLVTRKHFNVHQRAVLQWLVYNSCINLTLGLFSSHAAVYTNKSARSSHTSAGGRVPRVPAEGQSGRCPRRGEWSCWGPALAPWCPSPAERDGAPAAPHTRSAAETESRWSRAALHPDKSPGAPPWEQERGHISPEPLNQTLLVLYT